MATAKQEQLLALKARLREGGGEKAVAKQHAAGKQTARERLEKLFDEGSFVETGLFVKHRCTNFGMDKKEVPGESPATAPSTAASPTRRPRTSPSSAARWARCTRLRLPPPRRRP